MGYLFTGKEFKNLYEYKFYTLSVFDEIHNGIKFENGINIDTIKFNPLDECMGGILFY